MPYVAYSVKFILKDNPSEPIVYNVFSNDSRTFCEVMDDIVTQFKKIYPSGYYDTFTLVSHINPDYVPSFSMI